MKNHVRIFLIIPVVVLFGFFAIFVAFRIYEAFITSDDPADFKYPISDILYVKYVEGLPFIKSGEFRPEYCEGRIDKLIRITPAAINKSKEEDLQGLLKDWNMQNNREEDKIAITENLKYEYSQLFDREPVDCYSLALTKTLRLHIRFDNNGNIFGGFNDTNWVVNSCD